MKRTGKMRDSLPEGSPPADDQKQKPKTKSSTLKGYLSLLIRLAVFLLILWVFFTQVLFLKRVSGTAMFPALKDGDLALGFRLESNYRSGDVILYKDTDGELHFGRILTIAGSTVNISGNGAVLINGVQESGEILFPTDDPGTLTYPYTVPEGSVFVLDDHRTEAEDSRVYGAISMDQIQGKVLSILRRRGL
jgi:signal peptidase I